MFALAVENLICNKRIMTCSFMITISLGHYSDIIYHFANNIFLKAKLKKFQQNIHLLTSKVAINYHC